MRKLIASSLFAVALAIGPGCKKSDPNDFGTHVELIKDSQKRATGFAGLEQLTKTVVTAPDNHDRIEDFGRKVVPAFEEIWDEAPEQQEAMLKLLLEVGHPSGAPVWNNAVELDGSSDARKKTILALEGIKKARAGESLEAVIEEFERVIAKPKLDQGKDEDGRVRVLLAAALGALADKKAVPVLIKAMEQTVDDQPVAVHRAAAEALGQIGDASAVDALLTVTFRVPDAPTSRNIAERSKVALVAIGAPAVPKVLQMMRGEHNEVQKLAAQNGVDQFTIQQTAALILGAIGAESAVDDLIGMMPKADCADTPQAAEPDAAGAGLRAFVATALGFIGDKRAVAPLCGCIFATKNPGDMYPIIEALGRIGGPEALSCLLTVVKQGEYAKDAVADASFLYEPRWQAGRSAVLVAGPSDLGALDEAFSGGQTDAKVQAELAALGPGLDLLKRCKADRACYETTLADATADWFAREKAAFELARLAPGDVAAAEAIAKAFKVRNPTARVSMALLPPLMLAGKRCQACVDAYEQVLEAEKMSMAAEYQLSVLVVRSSLVRLREPNAPSGATDASK